MDDCIDRANGYGIAVARVGIVIDVEVGGERIEDLAGVGEIGAKGVDSRVGVRDEVEVEDAVAAGEEVGDHVAACFAGAASEDDAFTGWRGVHCMLERTARIGKRLWDEKKSILIVRLCTEADDIN